MQANDPWRLPIPKVTLHGFPHIGFQLFPGVRFGENALTERPCDKAAIWRILNEKNDFT